MNAVHETLALLRSHWRVFIGIHLAANLFVAAVLGPLLSLVLQLLMLGIGEKALTDQDILFAFLSPLGFVLFVTGIALVMAVSVFESAALMLATFRTQRGAAVSFWRLGRYLLARLSEIFRLAVIITLQIILRSAPFLILAGWLYLRYLTEYDINYYLSQHPPEFVRVGGAIALILLVWAGTLLPVLMKWVLALPLVLLGQCPPRQALAQSGRSIAAQKSQVTKFLLAWGAGSVALLLMAGGFLKLGGIAVIGFAGDSLMTLAWLTAGLLLIWSIINFMVSLLIGLSFAVGMLDLYRRLGDGVHADLSQVDRQAPKRGFGRWALVALLFVVTSTALFLREQLSAAGAVNTPAVYAHRGASFDAPENTLAAIEEAIAQGADWAEIDVQETASGEILVIHDKDLMKVAGSALRVYDAPLEALRQVDIGSYRAAQFADQRVPLFAEVLELARGRIKLNVELKYYGQEQQLEARVAELIEAHGMADDVVIMSLSLPGVRAMKALRPAWKVGLLSSVAVGDVSRLDVDFFAVNASFATRKFVNRAHGRGRQVLAWTVNDPAGMSAIASQGVDGIITDRPGLAKAVLAERAGLETHERMLLALASLLGSDFEQEP